MTLYIFDLDGTLVRPIKGVTIPNNITQQEMIPGVIERCEQLRADGHLLAVASNQGGVALGLCRREDAMERTSAAAEAIGADVNWLISVYHAQNTVGKLIHSPEEGIAAHKFWRKPNPGMLFYFMLYLEFPAVNTVFIGDMDFDQQAAAAAGVRFEWAKDFFGWT